MNRVLAIVSAFLAVSAVTLSSVYANQPEGWLENHKEIRVGVPDQLAPLVSIKNGKPEGLDVDLLTKFTREFSANIVWKPCGAWQQCLNAIKNK
ncbi:MAG: transporter substrate-binding domain-containing protein, partial [Pseudomonadota bacterium]